MPVRIVLFDDNTKIVEAFRLLFSESPGFVLCACFTDTLWIEKRIETSKPDVVLMDINIPPVDGIEATRIINRKFPDVRIIIQTVFDEDKKVFAALCAGASGYLLKSSNTDMMMKAISDIMDGGMPMSPSIAVKVLNLFRTGAMRNLSLSGQENYQLSKREKGVLKLLVNGFSYKMIASDCGISYETVKSHIRNIYSKLQVASMTEAVAKAINEGLV